MICPYCQGSHIQKRGKHRNGSQRWYCIACNKSYTDNTEQKEDTTVWEYLNKNVKEKVPLNDFFDLAHKHQKLHQDLSQSQDIAKIKFTTDENWIAIVFSADWHFGSVSVDYKSLEAHLKTIIDNPLYLITVGDLNDNFRRFRTLQPVLSQIFSPKEQAEFLRALIPEMSGKWLAATWGNHDIEFDEQLYGESPIKELLSKHFAYFNGKGILELQINKEIYRIGMSHYFKGHSIYNPTHSLIRAIKDDFGPLVQVVVQGHKHQHAYQFFNKYEVAKELGYTELGGELHLLHVGTFEVDSGYSKRFWGKGQIGVPVLLFNSNQHEIVWFPKVDQALRYL